MGEYNRQQRLRQNSAEVDNQMSNDTGRDSIPRLPQHKIYRNSHVEASMSEDTPDWLRSPDLLAIPSNQDIANDLLETVKTTRAGQKTRHHAHEYKRNIRSDVRNHGHEQRDADHDSEENCKIANQSSRREMTDERHTSRGQQSRQVLERGKGGHKNTLHAKKSNRNGEKRVQQSQVDTFKDNEQMIKSSLRKDCIPYHYDEERPQTSINQVGEFIDNSTGKAPSQHSEHDLPHGNGISTKVETRATNYDENRNCFGSRHMKRIVLPMMFYCVVITCIGGWLLREFYRIPGLNDEIAELRVQVDKLVDEVVNLTSENDRLEKNINKLSNISNGLELTTSDLTIENERLKDFTNDFNGTLVEYQEQNEILRAENYRYGEYTKTLNQTVDNLVTELAKATDAEKRLTSVVGQYKTISESMEAEILTLTDHTNVLNETVIELSDATAIFEEQNHELSQLNEDLGKIVAFLEVETSSVQSSYEELVEQLADTILRKEVLAEIGLKERMQAELAGWECGFLTAFGSQEFAKNDSVSIGYSSYDTVMNYISDRLLSDLCIVRGNLEFFLRDQVLLPGMEIWEINMKDLAFGVNLYSTNVLNHYFPGNSESGLDRSDWDAADYECKNLSYEDRYLYDSTA